VNLVDVSLDPKPKVLREFGFVALVAFGLLGGVALWRSTLFGFGLGEAAAPVATGFFILGGLSGLLSLVAPKANRPLYVALVVVTYPIGFVLSFVILGVLFYLILTPVGLFFRLIGRDGLQVRPDPSAKSFWIDREGEQRDAASYFKQF
jgi:hypothetical protein